MKNINEILSGFGITVSEDKQTEFMKLVNENYKTISEHNKTVAKMNEYKTGKETAEEALKGFEGIDPTKIQEQLNDYKLKAQKAEQDAQRRLAERDFDDALKGELDKIGFTSTAARKAVEADIRAMDLKFHEGKIMGLSDAIESIRSSDASAFVDKAQQELENNRAKFTGPNNNSGFRGTTPQELGKLPMADYIAARKKK